MSVHLVYIILLLSNSESIQCLDYQQETNSIILADISHDINVYTYTCAYTRQNFIALFTYSTFTVRSQNKIYSDNN